MYTVLELQLKIFVLFLLTPVEMSVSEEAFSLAQHHEKQKGLSKMAFSPDFPKIMSEIPL